MDKSGPCVVKLDWYSGWKSRLGIVAFPSSNRSGDGGNEVVEAFDGKDHVGDSAKQQAVTQVKTR